VNQNHSHSPVDSRPVVVRFAIVEFQVNLLRCVERIIDGELKTAIVRPIGRKHLTPARHVTSCVCVCVELRCSASCCDERASVTESANESVLGGRAFGCVEFCPHLGIGVDVAILPQEQFGRLVLRHVRARRWKKKSWLPLCVIVQGQCSACLLRWF
jgi:hypothetical protein